MPRLRAWRSTQYKAEAIGALVQTTPGILEQHKDLFAFGAGMDTPDKWKK